MEILCTIVEKTFIFNNIFFHLLLKNLTLDSPRIFFGFQAQKSCICIYYMDLYCFLIVFFYTFLSKMGPVNNAHNHLCLMYFSGVYDITDFVAVHPGAKNVELAAGGAVEPFWELYAVHKGNQEVYDMLEQYRIGNLKEEDVLANARG